MVVERSRRSCLLCGSSFEGRTFLCRDCSDCYRDQEVSLAVRRQFYEALDRQYPERSNTYGDYNEPVALLEAIQRIPRSARILELGAGGGFLADTILDLGFRQLTLSDVSMTALEELKLRFPELLIVGADAARLPFKSGVFEVVITSDVIEHLPDVERHVAEVERVLAPGGLYLLKTPNRLLAEPFYRARGLHDYHFWHPSMFTPGELRRLLESSGFEVRFLRPTALTGAQLAKLPLANVIGPVMARISINRIPVSLHPHLEVTARKHPTGVE